MTTVSWAAEPVSRRFGELATDPRFRGPPGEPGPAGRDGASADVDRLAQQIRRRLAGSIRVRVEPIRR